MFIVLSPNSPDPMYKQVTDQIKEAIGTGDLEPNEKLPSIRELTQTLNISAITIKRAYIDLENEGYIFTRAGLGSFVAEIDRAELQAGKLEEITSELTRLLAMGRKFRITAADIKRLINQLEEK